MLINFLVRTLQCTENLFFHFFVHESMKKSPSKVKENWRYFSWQNKKDHRFAFYTGVSWEKDPIFGASKQKFGLSYFVFAKKAHFRQN